MKKFTFIKTVRVTYICDKDVIIGYGCSGSGNPDKISTENKVDCICRINAVKLADFILTATLSISTLPTLHTRFRYHISVLLLITYVH